MNYDNILLISCYELGHQPTGIAMPLALLDKAGYKVDVLDIANTAMELDKILLAKFVGISVPMHTALRLGVQVAEEIRKLNPSCHICFYGLYAFSNSDYLLNTLADSIIGGEFEIALVELVKAVINNIPINIEGVGTKENKPRPIMKRLEFSLPNRKSLPQLSNYTKLLYQGEERLTGYLEASRGCLHFCTHCPIPAVYQGKFFVIPKDIVLSDIRQLVTTGAHHITFGDPDFLNGPNHSLKILRAMHKEFPKITFDFTTKIEHILKHREIFPELNELGAIFLVSALESFSDKVLKELDKGHSREDIFTALEITRKVNISLRPTFVAFTPWTTLDDYLEMLDFIVKEDLIEQVDVVQYTLRLLIPPGSLILNKSDNTDWLGELNQKAFSYEWIHPDSKLDKLHKEVSKLVEQALKEQKSSQEIFLQVLDLANQAKFGKSSIKNLVLPSPKLMPPRLTEAWFC